MSASHILFLTLGAVGLEMTRECGFCGLDRAFFQCHCRILGSVFQISWSGDFGESIVPGRHLRFLPRVAGVSALNAASGT